MYRYKRTEENERKVLEAHTRLKTYAAVAAEVGCSVNTVQRICVKYGVNPGQGKYNGVYGGGTSLKVTDAQLREDALTLTRKEIAQKYGMHPESLNRRFRRLGIHPQPRKYEKKFVRRRTWGEYKQEIERQKQERQKKKQEEKDKKLEIRYCEVCGREFKCNKKEKRKTCTTICSKRRKTAKADHRIPKEKKIDVITIERLYERDGGICYICGGKCDFNSSNYSANGNWYPGDNYPEIEHVFPLSRGGVHSWGNVRLACHRCNAEKSDKLMKDIPPAKALPSKRRQAKKTQQSTLDGQVIKEWSSVGEIERMTGLNAKRIQDVCRERASGKGKGAAFGYIWQYV